MTSEQMRRGLEVEAAARKIKKQFDTWVLLKLDGGATAEVINVGDPVSFKEGEYHRMKVQIPDVIRRLAFRQWRKELAFKYNEHLRELNQLGVSHDLRLIEFSPATGEPR